jgi:hypothetical protein
MNAGAARAAIAIREAERAAEAASSWYAAHSYSVQKREEEFERQNAAVAQAAVAKLEAKYQARRLAKKAALEKAATSGPGWRVLDRDHRELYRLARDIYDLGLMATPWPSGWTVKWADLRGRNALGMCAHDQKLILIDAAAHRGFSFSSDARQFEETLVHEIVHMLHPGGAHGAAFRETLRRLLAYVMPADEPVEVAARPSLTPRKGVMFSGKAVPWAGAGDWEFR